MEIVVPLVIFVVGALVFGGAVFVVRRFVNISALQPNNETVPHYLSIVIGIYGIWRWSNARGVERMIAVARDKGEPTTPEELAAAYPTSPEIERTTQLWLNALEQADLPYRPEDYYDVAIAGSGRPGDEESWAEMRRYAGSSWATGPAIACWPGRRRSACRCPLHAVSPDWASRSSPIRGRSTEPATPSTAPYGTRASARASSSRPR